MLLAFLLAAAPAPTVYRFVHFLDGSPVGQIELRRSGEKYEYISRRFFRRGKASEERFAPPDQTTWASESLMKARPVGCYPVLDEITRKSGEVCVKEAKGKSMTTGTVLGATFTARYEKDLLQTLEVGDSTFVRSDAPVDFRDPFGDGFPIAGNAGDWTVTPPVEGARPASPTPDGEDIDCLGAAHAFVAKHPEWDVVLGLVEDGGRGWPHAWVQHRVTKEERDPSRGLTARYLALPRAAAPRIYLDLLGKRRTLARVRGP